MMSDFDYLIIDIPSYWTHISTHTHVCIFAKHTKVFLELHFEGQWKIYLFDSLSPPSIIDIFLS